MNNHLIALICILILSGYSLKSQTASQLFEQEEPLEFIIKGHIDSLVSHDRDTNSQYRRAYLTYKEGRDKREIKVKLKTRGNFRLRPNVCNFPPLKLKISEQQAAGTVFEGQHKLKLVTHCFSEEYIFREYLIYKLFNLFTENSFQVRLAKITYKDENRQLPPQKSYAFIIEDEEVMAARLGGEILDVNGIEDKTLDKDQDLLIRLFHYMVGNLDWNYYQLKNMELVSIDNGKRNLPIPYDFDFSACVNPPYTNLGEDFEFRNFKSICYTEEEYKRYFELFKQKKPEIQALIDDFRYLSKTDRDEIMQYLEEFYQMINDPEQVERIFLAACKQNE